MPDNYVVREKYTGLAIVDGQVIPVRENVDSSELVPTQPDDEGSHRNGGGTGNRRRKAGE